MATGDHRFRRQASSNALHGQIGAMRHDTQGIPVHMIAKFGLELHPSWIEALTPRFCDLRLEAVIITRKSTLKPIYGLPHLPRFEGRPAIHAARSLRRFPRQENARFSGAIPQVTNRAQRDSEAPEPEQTGYEIPRQTGCSYRLV
ncbi:hypothetical protein E4Z66_06870 [Aliishimia ponticola]|uniref:Uncharacterized protein n=1 Tax=Aliishimia ponticola TaxID=2499833 RepID=A0A4S4NDQ6_9RHOB|nr:hypothetical protein [Aliishimia ponticola]THH36667.1 hypothetical protein E4Z66_06870 [Aliishimia ponticola]